MPQIADPAVVAKVRKGYQGLMRAAVLEMALGVFCAIFPVVGRGSFHVLAGIVIIAGGVGILVIALRVRRKIRASDRVG